MRLVERVNRRQIVVGATVLVVVASTIGITVAARGSSTGNTLSSDTSLAVAAPTTADTATTTAVPNRAHSRAAVAPSSTTTTSTTLKVPAPSSSTTTTTTIAPALLLPTLSEGDSGPEVITLQRMLNHATGSTIAADGIFGPDTAQAIRNLQTIAGLEVTGAADHATRTLLAELDEGRSSALPAWPVPTIGNGGANGCQVAVVGDSLMAYSASLHVDALREINCAPAVDGVGGRSLAWGWQCRVAKPGGRSPLLLLPAPEPGNETCAPSGLELLRLWANANAFGDIVVNALGTNDAGLFDEARWIRNWDEALRLTGGRPMIFVTTKARPGSNRTADLDRYSATLRRWCDAQPRCHLADWALTAAATDAASYVDAVHLTRAATVARAGFIRDAVLALFEGRPAPNPAPLPVVTPVLPPAPTTVAPTTVAPTTTSTTSTTSTTLPRATSTTIAVTTSTAVTASSTVPATTTAPTTIAPTSSTTSTPAEPPDE